MAQAYSPGVLPDIELAADATAQALKDGSLQPRTLQGLGTLVLDEADLLLSFGYEHDLRQLQPLVSTDLHKCNISQAPMTQALQREALAHLTFAFTHS